MKKILNPYLLTLLFALTIVGACKSKGELRSQGLGTRDWGLGRLCQPRLLPLVASSPRRFAPDLGSVFGIRWLKGAASQINMLIDN